jgi:hypothetical protein
MLIHFYVDHREGQNSGLSEPGIIESEISSSTSKTEGNYRSRKDSNEDFAKLKLRHVSEGVYYFAITVGSESGCEGFVDGVIDFQKAGKVL